MVIPNRGTFWAVDSVDQEQQLFNLTYVEPEQIRLERFLNPLLPVPIKFKPFLISRTDANSQDDAEAECL